MTRHFCHWPGCPIEVPPKLWGCRRHWFMLPGEIRAWIWKTYRPGQEITKDPSVEYCEAAAAAQNWIAQNHAHKDASVAASAIKSVHSQEVTERQGKLF